MMFPKFFKHKMREVGSFLRIMKGKVTGNDHERARGVDQALNAMKDERRVYEEEKDDALNAFDRDTKRNDSGGQDISAI